MPYLELNSEITIGSFRFTGVHDVHIKKGMHGYVSTAMVKVPSVAYIQKGKLQPDGSVKIVPGTRVAVNTKTKFNNGDPIVIKLCYNGVLKEEFRGFVKKRSGDMPIDVECEGFERQL